MAVGGSSGSTAGGMKLSRIGLTVKSIVSSIKEATSPDSARVSVVYHHIGKQVLNNEIARAAMTVSTLFVVTYVVGALVGIAHGYDATASIRGKRGNGFQWWLVVRHHHAGHAENARTHLYP